MTNNTGKPAKAKSKTPVARTTVAGSAKPSATKPAVRTRTAKAAASAVRKRVPATAKAATAEAKKTATRPSAARKSPPFLKKDAHELEPFIVKNKKVGKPPKLKKAKLIRDSFTMPEGEYAQIATLKKRCLDAGVSAKKSEILRAAVANMAKLSDASVVSAIRRLEIIKTGRPAKGSK